MTENRNVTVLYQVSNSSDSSIVSLYNAFEVPRNRDGSITLSVIKRHCTALRYLNHLGPDGYHWRVRVDDRAAPGSSKGSYTWWDIKDENARLPVKENVAMSELERMFMPNSDTGSSIEQSLRPVTNAASGAFNRLNKAIGAVANTVDGVSGTRSSSTKTQQESDFDTRIHVIAFKLLDLVKLNDDFASKRPETSSGGAMKQGRSPRSSQVRRSAPAPQAAARVTRAPQALPQRTAAQQPRRAAPAATPASRKPRTQSTGPLRPPPSSQNQAQSRAAAPRRTSKPLMDFTDVSPKPTLRKSMSLPIKTNISRAQKLKQEYEQQARKQNRVWDEIDQRWVAVEKGTSVQKGSVAAPPSSKQPDNPKKSNVKGISIDANNARGKSVLVQSAVLQRVDELKSSQNKAVTEHKQREAKLKASEEEEDIIRKKLEPKIKAWSEEHGKKKQLRALLASLHLILWDDSGWKRVCLGDILDEKKARRVYLKATLKVHPDKTRNLDAERRFIAKRVFDALSQAMREFDSNTN